MLRPAISIAATVLPADDAAVNHAAEFGIAESAGAADLAIHFKPTSLTGTGWVA
jgi:hypothetical protein